MTSDDDVSTVLDGIADPAAVVGPDGVLRAVNRPWQAFGEQNGVIPDDTGGLGGSYRTWLDDPDDPDAARAAHGVLSVIDGTTDEFQMVYPCHSDTEQRWFRLVVAPLGHEAPRSVVTVHARLVDRHGEAEYAATEPVAIPVVCAWCRRRERGPDREWRDLDDPTVYAERQVSHGICDGCLEAFV